MNWMLECVVILLTFLVFMLGPAWWMERRQNRRVPVARLADPAPLPAELPRAGRFDVTWHDPPFAGESRPVQPPIPWDLAGAAYALGQQRTSQDEITRQVDAIMLEVELDPRWRYR